MKDKPTYEILDDVIEDFRGKVETNFHLSIGPEMKSAVRQAYQKGFDNGIRHEKERQKNDARRNPI